MLFSLNLLEIFPLTIINIFFFLIFSTVLILSYPIGRYFLVNHCENSLIKYSLFSIIIFAAIISIIINLAPIFAKYVIGIFYLTNLFILVINSKIRKDFFKAIISFKFLFLVIFFVFLILDVFQKTIFIENDKLVFMYDSHHVYFIDPITEILTSDYFSRLKITSLYPSEWKTYHFFAASFNSIFFLPIYQSGVIGLPTLKIFYLSIFLSLFFSSFFKNENYSKNAYLLIIVKVFLIILFFISLFFTKIIYLVLTNHFVSTLAAAFLIQSLLSKNKSDFLIWTIILSLSSIKTIFISFMLIVYYLIESQEFNLKNIITKIKKDLNFTNLMVAIIFLIYFTSTLLRGEIDLPKFNLPGANSWWDTTTADVIIKNYKYFILTIFSSLIIYLFLFKHFFNEKLNFFSYFKKQDLIYLSLIFIIPFICIVLLIFKNQIINIYNIEKLEIFFDYFNLTNLYYYFFVPLVWCFIFFWFKSLIRTIFLIAIIIYTFLSIFIYNGIILPGFFVLEILLLYYIFHILLDFKNANKKNILSYLFIATVVFFNIFNINYYDQPFRLYSDGEKLVFKIKDLRELTERKYLCPQDTNKFGLSKYSSTALSAILVKPYYSNISNIDKYENWRNASSRWASPPNKQIKNPCQTKNEI